ncbi:MAG TPA: hypothetical protein PL017_03920 [Tenuifilaceae bacterium]|nr:hypothetical protein [Tenuifilaceae bacterium]HPE18247.1 hypothetical protein [Tenuifilaceae bacterium]HPJ45222.1 hypothetical protein [Tenuifilaceae bacterium]HPQ33344.1 hypothetical protein [Tenuifilaceae bacterium]HRX68972.1 hypothetical protein [Tenuifilaceae bacterium]
MTTMQLTKRKTIGYILFDLVAIAFIYFVPTFSHLLNFPLYLIEPMRIALVIALVHTNRYNAYIIALTLPLFSFAVSAHPVFLKMLLITGELVLNAWIFYLLFSKTKNAFVSILSSIIISKGLYYLAKYSLISFSLLSASKLVATPIYIQAITTLVFSLYVGYIFWKRK